MVKNDVLRYDNCLVIRMGEIGGIKPGYFSGYKAYKWIVPISVYNEDEDITYTVTSISEDEGFLLINVRNKLQPPKEPNDS